jgi:hypothetical protein
MQKKVASRDAVKDRTWGYNEIGVKGCARHYLVMNGEIEVYLAALFRDECGDSSLLICLLLFCFRVKQVQKNRPRTD